MLINLLIGLVVGALIALCNAQSSIFERLELGLYNTRFETFRGLRAPSEDVVVLAIDEASLGEMETYPWRRDVHATMIERLMQLGVRAPGSCQYPQSP